MPQLDFFYYISQLFWLALSFSALLFLISKVISPNIREGLERRESLITQLRDAASETEKAIADLSSSYDRAIAEALAKSNEIVRHGIESVEAIKLMAIEGTNIDMERVFAEHKRNVDNFLISQTTHETLASLSLEIFRLYSQYLEPRYPVACTFEASEVHKLIEGLVAELLGNFNVLRGFTAGTKTSSSMHAKKNFDCLF